MTFCYQDMLVEEEIHELKKHRHSKEDLKSIQDDIRSELYDLYRESDRLEIELTAVEILLEKSK